MNDVNELRKLSEAISNQEVYVASLEEEAKRIRFPEVTASTLEDLDGAKKHLAHLKGALADLQKKTPER